MGGGTYWDAIANVVLTADGDDDRDQRRADFRVNAGVGDSLTLTALSGAGVWPSVKVFSGGTLAVGTLSSAAPSRAFGPDVARGELVHFTLPAGTASMTDGAVRLRILDSNRNLEARWRPARVRRRYSGLDYEIGAVVRSNPVGPALIDSTDPGGFPRPVPPPSSDGSSSG